MNDNSKPGDGVEFERIYTKWYKMNWIEKNMHEGAATMMVELRKAHTADRATDGAEIERLKADKSELVEWANQVCDMQKANCGMGTVTHYELAGLCETAKHLIAKYTEK